MDNHQTFKQLFDTYADDLLAISYAYLKDWNMAEDVVQDVFLKHWQKREQFRSDSSLKTYLTRAVINRSKDILKSWRYRTHILTNQFFTSTREKQALIEQEEQHTIGHAVLQLPIDLREIILLYFYKEFTYREIAELLNTPESTVRHRMTKAKQILREELNSEDWEVLQHE